MKDYSKYYKPEDLEPFFPDEFLRHVLVTVILGVGLLLGVIFLPESAQEAPDIGNVDISGKYNHWYLLPLRGLSMLLPNKAALLLVLGCAAVAFLSVPLWERAGERRLWRRPVFFPIVIVCLITIVALGVLGYVL